LSNLTRKDFQAIADILSDHKDIASSEQYQKLVNDFAIFCKMQNSNFNKEKFVDAVYLEA
jgi:hypothetical protein